MHQEDQVEDQIKQDALQRQARMDAVRANGKLIADGVKRAKAQALRNQLQTLQRQHESLVRQVSPTAMMNRLRGEIEKEAAAYWRRLDDLAVSGALTLADLDLESQGAQCYFHADRIIEVLKRSTKEITLGQVGSREASMGALASQIEIVRAEMERQGISPQ